MCLKEAHVFIFTPHGSQHPMQMATKVLQTISWVFVHLLPWAQHKKWIPVRSMGCVHTP
jgi:hypothetical protein